MEVSQPDFKERGSCALHFIKAPQVTVISNLYPEATELNAQSAILIGCCLLGYPRYSLLVSNGSVQLVESTSSPFLVHSVLSHPYSQRRFFSGRVSSTWGLTYVKYSRSFFHFYLDFPWEREACAPCMRVRLTLTQQFINEIREDIVAAIGSQLLQPEDSRRWTKTFVVQECLTYLTNFVVQAASSLFQIVVRTQQCFQVADALLEGSMIYSRTESMISNILTSSNL